MQGVVCAFRLIPASTSSVTCSKMLCMVRVTICGLSNAADAKLCAELGAHAIGLNFYPKSPRAISPFTAEKIIRELPPFISTVGIFVNWGPEAVIALAQAL